MVQPYPLPRGIRESAVLLADGINATYGPFQFQIFDIEDVDIFILDEEAKVWNSVEAIVTKANPTAPLSDFSITFAEPPAEDAQYVVSGRRVAERSTSVSKGASLSVDALERELSKQAVAQQELRRDVDASLRIPFGFASPEVQVPEEGRTLLWDLSGARPRLVAGPNAADIAVAEGYAEDAHVSAQQAIAARDAAESTAASILPRAFASKFAVEVAYISVFASRISTAFYAPLYAMPATLVGGANYTRRDVEPTHELKIRSADGAWWEIDEQHIDITMAGAVADGRDISSALQSCFDSGFSSIFVPPGEFCLRSQTEIPASEGLTLWGIKGRSIIRAHSEKPVDGVALIRTTFADAPVRTVKNLNIQGIVFDGGSLAPQRWLQDSSGNPVTNPEADYYDASTNPDGKIGNPSYPDYTIEDAVAEGRRNPLRTQVSYLLRLRGVDGGNVDDCEFRNHFAPALEEAGSRNLEISGNHFENVGKNDGPYPAIWSQCFGTVGAGQAFFQDSENIIIRGNTAKNLERCFAIFGPTKGGKVLDNYIDGWGESCIFVPEGIVNVNGGYVEIVGNTMIDGTLTDIACSGIEMGNALRVRAQRNRIVRSGLEAIIATGATNCYVGDNQFVECFKDGLTYPYGPFSERYAYNVGSEPIAGMIIDIAGGEVIRIGVLAGHGNNGLTVARNLFEETRDAFPVCIRAERTGGSNLARDVDILGNTLTVPSGMTFFAFQNDVFNSEMSLRIKGNKRHASEAPVVYSLALASGETGVKDIDVGFRPSRVSTYSSGNGGTNARVAHGDMVWRRDGTRSDFTVAQTGGSTPYGLLISDELARQVNSSGLTTVAVEFGSWKETGFSINVLTASEGFRLYFVCEP